MRSKIALVTAGLAAAAFLPVQPASAVCMLDLSSVGGPSCYNPCNTVAGVYNRVDDAAKDALADMDCLA
jgi:hypothetical protein